MTEQNSVPDASVESDRATISGGMGHQQTQERRHVFRKLLALAGLGITGALLSQVNTDLLPRVQATSGTGPSGALVIDSGPTTGTSPNTGTATTLLISSPSAAKAFEVDTADPDGTAFFGYATATSGGTGGGTIGVQGQSDHPNGAGLFGWATDKGPGTGPNPGSAGVFGISYSRNGIGVYGQADGGTFGTPLGPPPDEGTIAVAGHATALTGVAEGVRGRSDSTSGIGVHGRATANGGISLQGTAVNDGAIPLVAVGNSSTQTANLQEWRSGPPPGTALSVVDVNGNFGVGTASPKSHLFVVDSTASTSRGIVAAQHINTASAALMQMTKSRGTESSPSAIMNGDYVGAFNMNAYDGTSYLGGAPMAGWGARVNGTVSTGSIPADLFFYTKPSGTTDPYGDNVVRFIIASNGSIFANGSLLSSSDERLKTDIEPIPNALEKVLALNGVYFHWREDANQPDGRQVGVIAQNVQQVLPEIVSTSPATEDYLSVDYTRLVPVLIQAMKEQQLEIQQLKEMKEQQEQFRSENESFHAEVRELKRIVKQLPAS